MTFIKPFIVVGFICNLIDFFQLPDFDLCNLNKSYVIIIFIITIFIKFVLIRIAIGQTIEYENR